jgi:hypothetical protein
MEQIVIGILVIAGAWFIAYQYSDNKSVETILNEGMDKPILWIYVNNSDINSRSWADFMARSGDVMNLPFLNLCYKTIVKQNSAVYRVEVIGGLQDLAQRLGGWKALPTPLQNAEAVVREPELNWIRAAVLAKWGGLWMSPSLVSTSPIGPLPSKRVVFFGVDTDPMYSRYTDVPSLNVIWSPQPNHPVWVVWEERVRDRLERRTGGAEFRHDEKTDTAFILKKYGEECVVVQTAEASRKGSAGRRLELEDLLAAGGFKLALTPEVKYVPIAYPEILERSAFGWFLRMSEEQIINSDLVISDVFRKALL